MKVITCISDIENPGYLYGLKASAQYYDLDLITVVTQNSNWETHRNKDIELLKALDSIANDEIILFTDGYDVLFLGNETQLVEKYNQAVNGKELLISAEKSCYPDTSLRQYFTEFPTEFKYVNSGGIMGKAKDFRDALNRIEEIRKTIESENDLFPHSNQYLWTLFFIDNKNKIALDYECKLFQTLTPKMDSVRHLWEMEEDIDNRKEYAMREFEKINEDFDTCEMIKVRNIRTNQVPLHLHFNSPLSKFGMFQEPYINWIEHFNMNNGLANQI